MKFKANSYDIVKTPAGDVKLTLNIGKEFGYPVLKMIEDEDLKGDLTVEIKKYRKARTQDQNSLLYAIEDKLAKALKLSNKEVHFRNLLDYGVCIGEAVMLAKFALEYCKDNYAEIITEKEKDGICQAKVRLYKGSSQMDTKEFASLVDGVLSECENIGVNVEYESKEIKRLLENYNDKFSTNKSN
jgi:transcription termination factor NusB